MSSWISSPFPIDNMRRRSRSRSPPPDRRMYYERDWVREREWADYERERAEWEYRRPGAVGRSPGIYDDRRLKRRRSMSPPYAYERDRYEPRPRYGDEYNDYRGPPPGRFSPPPRGGYRPYSPPRPPRGPVDPRELDYPATFRHFSEWFRLNYPGVVAEEEPQARKAEVDPNAKTTSPMKKRYDEYRRGITNQQVQILFDHHKTSAWFLERYDLSEQYATLRSRTRKLGWKGKIDEFVYGLEQGRYDPVLELDATTPPANGVGAVPEPSNMESNGGESGGDVDMMNEESRQDDEMDIAMFDNEANNDGAGGPSAPSGSGNEKSQYPPMPAQAEEVSVEPEGVQIMIRTIPPDIGRVKIEEICSKIPGFMYLALGDPMQKRNYYRCGWIRFADDVDVPDVVAKLSEAKIDGFRMQVSHSTRPFVSKMRITPSIASRPERVLVDLEKIRKLASVLEEQADVLVHLPSDEAEMEPEQKDRGTLAVEERAKHLASALDREFPNAEEEKLTAKKNSMALDLYLAYLRNAFHCCYFCVAVCDHAEELLRKCIKHGRTPPSNSADWKETRWIEWLDSKLALLIDRDNVDPLVYGGKDPQKELAKFCDAHLKREDEGKFRCNLCTKLFKAESFVEKHIANKHPEVVTGLEDIPFYNTFALDPHRIQPFTHAPPANGNQQAPPQAYGLRPVHREASNGGGYGDMSRPQYPPHSHAPPPPPMAFGGYGEYPPPPDPYYRRRSPQPKRRLSDRLGERMHDHAPLILSGIEGLPPKPSTVAEPMSDNRGGTGSASTAPPPKVKEDPRAAAGRKVSYLDMDEVAEGDVELSY